MSRLFHGKQSNTSTRTDVGTVQRDSLGGGGGGGSGSSGGSGGRGVGSGIEDFVFGSDIPSLPTHWKPMSEMFARFSIFHIDLYHSKITAGEANYVYKILRQCFRPMDFHDLNGGLGCKKGGASSVSGVKRKKNERVDRAASKQPLDSTKMLGKQDFYDLTMTDPEFDECVEKEEYLVEADKIPDDEIDEEMAQIAPDARPSVAMFRALDAIVRIVGLNRSQRVVEVHQLQNFESWEMYRAFHVIHKLIATHEVVYHGTTSGALDGITREGIRGLYSQRSAHGRGTYVTRDFDVACSWATPDNNNLKHIIVLRCQVGAVKQVGSGICANDFYGTNEDGKNVLFNTKEVKTLKYLITGSDAQLVAEAIVTIEEMNPSAAKQFKSSSTSNVLPFKNPKSGGTSGNSNLLNQDQNSDKYATAIFNILSAMTHDNLANAVVPTNTANVMSNSNPSLSAGNSDFLTKKRKNVVVYNGTNDDKMAETSIFRGVVEKDDSAEKQSAVVQKMSNARGSVGKGKSTKKSNAVLQKKTETVLEKQQRHAKTLLERQAPLPLSHIDVLHFRNILKGSVVTLKNLDKSKHYAEKAEGVVKLIVKECAASFGNHKFMIEMRDDTMFSRITSSNQRREKRYSQTGYSRYGPDMREHYLICKHAQMTLKQDTDGVFSVSDASSESSSDSA